MKKNKGEQINLVEMIIFGFLSLPALNFFTFPFVFAWNVFKFKKNFSIGAAIAPFIPGGQFILLFKRIKNGSIKIR